MPDDLISFWDEDELDPEIGPDPLPPQISAQSLQPKLKRAQSLVGTSPGRAADDYYPSPSDAVEALLRAETFTGSIWEPACGDGAICRVLEARGYQDVIATDLIDRGYGEAPHDFLTCDRTADNIITNPPFKMAQEFVERSLALTTRKCAFLLKLQFLEGIKRRTMFETTPLARVHVFSKRIKMARDGKGDQYGSSMICFAWFVWEHGHVGPPILGWI